jgi:pseudouridine-5'-phosphate glycosidase
VSIHYSKEVAAALKSGAPLVALESTIISHGLPRPSNLSVAIEVEEIVRAHGAVPATIAILDGQIHVGLESDQLVAIANRDDIAKASIRDLAMISAGKTSAATTVAATSHIAQLAGCCRFS